MVASVVDPGPAPMGPQPHGSACAPTGITDAGSERGTVPPGPKQIGKPAGVGLGDAGLGGVIDMNPAKPLVIPFGLFKVVEE